MTLGVLMILASLVSSSKAPEGDSKLPVIDSLWNYENPAESEITFLNTLELYATKAPVQYKIELLTQVARAQGLQRKFKDAFGTLEDAQKALKPGMDRAQIRILLEKGRLFNSSQKPAEARPLFLKAWELALAAKEDGLALDAAHMMGIIAPPDKQLDWNLKALKIAESSSSKSLKGWLGPLYNNIGWTYHDQEKYPEALEMFQKGLKWRNDIGDIPGARIAEWTVARTYRSLGRIDEALSIQKKLESGFSSPEIKPDGYVYEELGELYLLKNDPQAAAGYFKKAFDILSQDPWLQANESSHLQRLKKLSQPPSKK